MRRSDNCRIRCDAGWISVANRASGSSPHAEGHAKLTPEPLLCRPVVSKRPANLLQFPGMIGCVAPGRPDMRKTAPHGVPCALVTNVADLSWEASITRAFFSSALFLRTAALAAAAFLANFAPLFGRHVSRRRLPPIFPPRRPISLMTRRSASSFMLIS